MQPRQDKIQRSTPQAAVPFYNDPKKRSLLFQIATLLMVGLVAYYLISNTLTNVEKQSIATGFGFLQKEAAFEIGESPFVIPRPTLMAAPWWSAF
jgi:general L-amino acid transport system permease protein